MNKYRIFDSGPDKGADRYTLIAGPLRSREPLPMYGFNEIPFHPQGIGQYVGEWKGGNTRHLGKRIQLSDLPEQAQRFVTERIADQ